MMKEIIKHIISLCLILVSFNLIGQSEAITVAHSLKDQSTAMSITVEEEGSYEVLVLSPNGEVQSRPVKLQQFKAGQLIQFDLNSKYWKSGQYHVMVRNDEQRVVTTRRLIVDLSESQKLRLKKPE